MTDPDLPDFTVVYEPCDELKIWLRSQPDWRTDEFTLTGPKSVLRGFKCPRHTSHLVLKSLPDVSHVYMGVMH
jgi:hypothetical protein